MPEPCKEDYCDRSGTYRDGLCRECFEKLMQRGRRDAEPTAIVDRRLQPSWWVRRKRKGL